MLHSRICMKTIIHYRTAIKVNKLSIFFCDYTSQFEREQRVNVKRPCMLKHLFSIQNHTQV